jgi:GTPase Era involved in 16S rRNA processing
MAELIREAALEGVRDELPHSLAVVIDEVRPLVRTTTIWSTCTRSSTSSATVRRAL